MQVLFCQIATRINIFFKTPYLVKCQYEYLCNLPSGLNLDTIRADLKSETVRVIKLRELASLCARAGRRPEAICEFGTNTNNSFVPAKSRSICIVRSFVRNAVPNIERNTFLLVHLFFLAKKRGVSP